MKLMFKKIELGDRELLTPHLLGFRFIDLGFASLYYCAEAFNIFWAMIGDTLCLRFGAEGSYFYTLSDYTSLSDIADLLCRQDGGTVVRFGLVEEADVPRCQALSGYQCTLEYAEEESDFFATRQDYIALDKSAAHRKVYDYERFCKKNTYQLYELTAQHLATAKSILDGWCAQHTCSACAHGCEKQWILRMFEAWDELPVKGTLLDINGVASSFSVYEQNGAIVLHLIGKSIGKVLGAGVYSYIESVRRLFPDADYINFSPDCGLPGLQEFKGKFTPYTKLKKYMATLSAKA